jgi:hypothetical protein
MDAFFKNNKKGYCVKIPRTLHSILILQGRIAQLVELLSYTQAVIGSSPVAPKALQNMRE